MDKDSPQPLSRDGGWHKNISARKYPDYYLLSLIHIGCQIWMEIHTREIPFYQIKWSTLKSSENQKDNVDPNCSFLKNYVYFTKLTYNWASDSISSGKIQYNISTWQNNRYFFLGFFSPNKLPQTVYNYQSPRRWRLMMMIPDVILI